MIRERPRSSGGRKAERLEDALLSIKRRASSARDCVYCKEAIGKSGHAWCPNCKTVVHKDCADELAGCPSLGCHGELARFTPRELSSNVGRQRRNKLIALGFMIAVVIAVTAALFAYVQATGRQGSPRLMLGVLALLIPILGQWSRVAEAWRRRGPRLAAIAVALLGIGLAALIADRGEALDLLRWPLMLASLILPGPGLLLLLGAEEEPE